MTISLNKVFNTWEDPDGFVYVEAIQPYRTSPSLFRITPSEFCKLLEQGEVTI